MESGKGGSPIGRNRTDNPKDRYTLVRVTKGEALLLKLKAAVYARGDVSRLIREAVDAYQGTVPPALGPCPTCKVPLELAEAEEEIAGVRFTCVPAHRCPVCGRVGLDSRIAVALEDVAVLLEPGTTAAVPDLLSPSAKQLVNA